MNSKEHNHSHDDHEHDHAHSHLPSDPELRVKAIETLLLSKGLIDPNTLDELIDTYENNIGPIPARNKDITDSSVTKPYTIIGKLGGIKIPKVPPAAKSPYTKFLLYPLLIISGIATTPIVAAVATETPDIAANIPQETIVATANPPGQCPTQA